MAFMSVIIIYYTKTKIIKRKIYPKRNTPCTSLLSISTTRPNRLDHAP